MDLCNFFNEIFSVSLEILLGLPYGAKKADVWAIGVIFYIFLTGNMPFKEDACNQKILDQVSF